MEFLPVLKLSWLNGWIYLVIFYGLFGFFLLGCPKSIVKKLYSRSDWGKRNYLLSAMGKPFSLACFALIIFSPIKLNSLVFWIGSGLYSTGCVVMFIALFNFRNTPVGQPVQSGIYQYSRNPQWVGLALVSVGTCVACGNGLALLLIGFGILFYHFRILGEESACLKAYGKSYMNYMVSVPRYLGLVKKRDL